MSEEQNPFEQLQEGLGQPQQNQGFADQTYNNVQNQGENLIQWQLELDNILERLEHLLRGDILKKNEETGEYEYTIPDDKSLIIFNEYGVQLFMNTITIYLNRNTILSNHKEVRINEILLELGYLMADLIWINYERMGLDCVEKRSRYELLVMSLLNMIESTYNRSLAGGERTSLREARVVNQTQPLGQFGQGYAAPQQKQRFSINPFRGFRK